MTHQILKTLSRIHYSKIPPICYFRRAKITDIEEIKTLITPRIIELFGDENVVDNAL